MNVKWFRVGLFDTLDESQPVLLAGDAWPALPSALRLGRDICDVIGRDMARHPGSSWTPALFEVAVPTCEAERRRIFELLGELPAWEQLTNGTFQSANDETILLRPVVTENVSSGSADSAVKFLDGSQAVAKFVASRVEELLSGEQNSDETAVKEST